MRERATATRAGVGASSTAAFAPAAIAALPKSMRERWTAWPCAAQLACGSTRGIQRGSWRRCPRLVRCQSTLPYCRERLAILVMTALPFWLTYVLHRARTNCPTRERAVVRALPSYDVGKDAIKRWGPWHPQEGSASFCQRESRVFPTPRMRV